MESGTISMIIMLKSSDGEEFTVPEAVAVQAQMIRIVIEDHCAQDIIPLNVSSKILAKVIDFCKQQVVDASSAVSVEEKNKWVNLFLDVDQKTLFDLILAANYLNIRVLLDLTCRRLADMIKGKSPEEIRKFFNNCER